MMIEKWRLRKTFYPHVTTEDFPINEILSFVSSDKVWSFHEWLKFLKQSFALNVYEHQAEGID